jgi:hypothetical protein
MIPLTTSKCKLNNSFFFKFDIGYIPFDGLSMMVVRNRLGKIWHIPSMRYLHTQQSVITGSGAIL